MGDTTHRSKRLKTTQDKQEKILIIILENAQLETAKIENKYELFCSDKHTNFLRKHGKDPNEYRPDIVHQCLLMLLDSPLNRENKLRVYIRTHKNVLIEINPQTRIPRTYERFSGLFVQLLHKLCIRADNGSQKLLKVIKNPVYSHLPVGCRKYLTSYNAQKLIDVQEIVPQNDESVAIVVGAMAKGKVIVDYCEEEIKVSSYPLSAALTCTRLCGAFENGWNIR